MFLLCLFASTAFYGVVAFGVCVFGFDLSASSIFDTASEGTGVAGSFAQYATLSLLAYPVLMVLHVLAVRLGMGVRRPTGFGSFLADVPSWVVADFTNPFRGLLALFGMRKVILSRGARGAFLWATQGLHLVWAVALWAWLATGLIVLGT